MLRRMKKISAHHKGFSSCFSLLEKEKFLNFFLCLKFFSWYLEPTNWINLINSQAIDLKVQPRKGNKIKKNWNDHISHLSGSGTASSICGCIDHVQCWLLEWEHHTTNNLTNTLARHWPASIILAQFMKPDIYCRFQQLMRPLSSSQVNKEDKVYIPTVETGDSASSRTSTDSANCNWIFGTTVRMARTSKA